MIDRRFLGFSLPPFCVVVDRWRVKLFCEAIGEENPVFWDRSAAAAAGFSECPVPPTFLKAIEAENHSSRAILDALGVALRGVLHAEQEFEFASPVYVGDEIRVVRTVADLFEKKGGALEFIAIETGFTRKGSPVGRARQLVMVRN
jgi:acyl dehydratase